MAEMRKWCWAYAANQVGFRGLTDEGFRVESRRSETLSLGMRLP